MRRLLRYKVENTARLSIACRQNSARYSSSSIPEDPLVQTLLRNPELSPEDAANEARWIRQEARENVQKQAAMLFGVSMPTIEDVEAMRGLESGVVMGLVERRAQGEPLQYVLGNVDFGPLNLICRPPTLIPRPETAHIFTRLSDVLLATSTPGSKPLHVLDLCSGSGCIPLLLSHQLQDRLHHALGIDISDKAIRLAQENAGLLDINNVSFSRRDIYSSEIVTDVLKACKGNKMSILTANPPYISDEEWKSLPRSVRQYEDKRALIGDQTIGGDGKGLSFYRRIAELLPDLLETEQGVSATGWKAVPRVVLEIGEAQAADVIDILANSGGGTFFTRTEVWQDQYGKDRAVVGRTG